MYLCKINEYQINCTNHHIILTCLLLFCTGYFSFAQAVDSIALSIPNDSIPSVNPTDSLATDSLGVNSDTIQLKYADGAIDSPIKYKAKDSIILDVKNQQIYMYNKAQVDQDGLNLTAGQINFDYSTKTAHAESITDTATGKLSQRPLFKEGGREFRADDLHYNFETKKGRLGHLVTKEGEGYLRGEKVKKNERDELFAQNAFYTTCNLEHPHFKIHVNKVKVIPDKVIVSGPAQLVLADVPTPLVLPFGIFPLRQKQTSGLLLPSYGYSPRQGYYLTEGGVYLALGQYLDLAITGDIYTNASWRLSAYSRYKVRYKYNGSLNVEFGRSNFGEIIIPEEYQRNKHYSIRWTHRQDAKARPNTTFNSSVNFTSRSYNTEYRVRNEDVLTNTITSSIGWSHSLPGTPFNISINATHNQNLNTGRTNITLPSYTLNMQRQLPFKRQNKVGKTQWFEKIYLTYSSNGQASISTFDTLLFNEPILDKLQYGIKHTASTGVNIPFLKYININPSFNYEESWYLKTSRKEWIADTMFVLDPITNEVTQVIKPHYETIDVNGFKAARSFRYGANASTTIYGTYDFSKLGKGRVQGLRHTINPSLGFTGRPDFGAERWGYWKKYLTPTSTYLTDLDTEDPNYYSIFENNLFTKPSRGKQASLTFGVNNYIQMKVLKSKQDTSGVQTEKINILDYFSINSSYNFAADSMRLAPFTFSGGTNLFKKKVRLSFGGSMSPYALNENGRQINQWEWTTNRRLLRLSNARVSLNTGFKGKDRRRKQPPGAVAANKRPSANTPARQAEQEAIDRNPSAYVQFNVPWQFNVNYTLGLSNTRVDGEPVSNITQTLSFNGEANLTPKWRVGVNSSYDFKNNQFGRTTIDIYRDLHCWEMTFLLAPFGVYRSYEFAIRVKSALLQDLKLTRRRRWQDFN